MNKAELRTLRIQFVLIAGIFAGSVVLALLVVFNRPWFEQYVQEKYVAFPAMDETAQSQSALHVAAQAAWEGRIDRTAFARLSEKQSLLVYDRWMTVTSPPASAPYVLTSINATLYLERAERTLVCGNPLQRAKALRFIELSAHPDAVPILDRYRPWARRHKDPSLLDRIDQAAERLQQTTEAQLDETSSSSDGIPLLPSNEGES